MIAPALTSEQWNDWHTRQHVDDGEVGVGCGNDRIDINSGSIPERSVPFVIATLNDALPVGSAYRITQQMVKALDVFIPGLMSVQEKMPNYDAQQLIALHDALEALLRPNA